MKVKLVRFMAFDGSVVQPRVIPGLGRVDHLAPGEDVKDVADGLATIASLDYEPRSGAIIIRKDKHKDNPGDASRSWNRSASSGEPKGDWCAVGIGNSQIIGDDPQTGPVNPPRSTLVYRGSETVEALKPDAEEIAAMVKAQEVGEPPRAKPIQQQGQQKGK